MRRLAGTPGRWAAGKLGPWKRAACIEPLSAASQRPRVPAVPRSSGLAVLVVLALLAATPLNACPVCYGNANSAVAQATDKATWFLLGTIGFVQIGFVALFYSFWRRAKALKRHREQFHLIHGGAR